LFKNKEVMSIAIFSGQVLFGGLAIILVFYSNFNFIKEMHVNTVTLLQKIVGLVSHFLPFPDL
jgi:hypothetical protein